MRVIAIVLLFAALSAASELEICNPSCSEPCVPGGPEVCALNADGYCFTKFSNCCEFTKAICDSKSKLDYQVMLAEYCTLENFACQPKNEKIH